MFGNHWPSRYSGFLESQSGRHLAAQTLRTCIESVQERYVNPKIIIAGDFNDQPTMKV
jgi:predicted extracellular nuclease